MSRAIAVIALLLLAGACSPDESATTPTPLAVEAPEAASFSLRNGEMRAMLLEEAEKREVELWINEDGSIGYHAEDGREVDQMMSWVYAVFWVNN